MVITGVQTISESQPSVLGSPIIVKHVQLP